MSVSVFEFSAAVPLLCLALAACDAKTEEREYTEVARFCASTGNSTDPTKMNLAVEVELATCLSSSCDTLIESSCDAEVNGTQITLTASGLVESKTKGDCTTDCGLIRPQCNLDLDPGTYTLSAGNIALEYTLGDDAACSDA